MEISTRRVVFLNTDCLKCLKVIRGDLHVNYNQPPRLGRNQGWGLWADRCRLRIDNKNMGHFTQVSEQFASNLLLTYGVSIIFITRCCMNVVQVVHVSTLLLWMHPSCHLMGRTFITMQVYVKPWVSHVTHHATCDFVDVCYVTY